MNAGAYGSEFKDVLESATALDATGGRHELSLADLHLTYRHSAVPADWIFVAARFKGTAGEKLAIACRMTEIQEAREQSQPIRAKTGGSTFANPSGHKAWQLIDEAGCRGIRRGGAMISDKHANFLINTGDATAADIEGLGEEVRARVLAKTGITLEWEIKRVGLPAGGAA
jgi:UDP-N-acetylmuramate dehydrogenase